MFGLKKQPAPAKGSTPSTNAAATSSSTTTTKQRGQIGEDAAALFLQARGYQIIARNWRPGNSLRGEIDAIAWTQNARGQKILCFVEVKARMGNLSSLPAKNNPPIREIAAPQEAVTLSKQRQIARLANAYVSIHKLDNVACRFDVVEVWLYREKAPHCSLCANAFDYRE